MKLTPREMLYLALLALAVVEPAAAQRIASELRMGVLVHDVPVLGEQREHGADINGELRFVSPVPDTWVAGIAPELRWLLTPRPHIGVDVNTSGYTSQLYIGLTWAVDLFHDLLLPQDRVFVALGFGPAFNNGHTAPTGGNHNALGSNVLFHPSVEIGYWFNPRESLSLYFEHSSDGGLVEHNDSLNNIGIRLGLGF